MRWSENRLQRKHIPKARVHKPVKPAQLQCASDTIRTHAEDLKQLQVFDYVTTPQGNGVVIRISLEKIGIILDTTGEVEYFELLKDIAQIQPVTFVPEIHALQEQCEGPSEDDEYRYPDPYG